jgi:uncharacterized protein
MVARRDGKNAGSLSRGKLHQKFSFFNPSTIMKKPQTLSLQEQLLQSGLASANKAKEVKAEKRKQGKLQRNNGVEVTDAVKQDLEQARKQQAERDRELNQLRKQAEEEKALLAQIRQVVEQNRIAQDENGIAYKFNDGNKVKTLYVPEKVRLAIIGGKSGIVRLDKGYEIVPAETALKIRDWHAESVLVLNQDAPGTTGGEDDPYAGFEVPDDLVW